MINILINDTKASVRNIDEIAFVVNFRGREFAELELNIDTLICVNETVNLINDWIEINGAFQGIPTTITSNGKSFEYYIDLVENPPIFRDQEIEVKIKKRRGFDSFFQIADALTFELLNSRGVNFNTFNVPYLIVKENVALEAIIVSISIFIIVKELAVAAKDATFLAGEAASAISISPGHAVGAALKAGAVLLYVGALALALLDLARRFREIVFPKINNIKACKIKDLIEKGCNNLGYNFQSNLLDNLSGLTFLPVPLVKEKESIFQVLFDKRTKSFTKGYPTENDTTPTLGNLIKAIEVIFNAKTKVNDGLVQIEQKDFFQSQSSNEITTGLSLQERRQNEFTLNTNEAFLRTYIHYQTDFSDIHTLDNFEPTDAEYGVKNLNEIDPDLNLLKGFKDINIPFALGVRKNELNFVENTAFKFFSKIDELIGTNFSGKLGNRVGVLQISSQFYSISKLLYTDINGNQPVNYLDILKASSIYNTYHKSEEIQNNGKKVYENTPLRLNFTEFENILNNNFAEINGENSEILELTYFPNKSSANISYEAEFDYTNSKVTTFTIND